MPSVPRSSSLPVPPHPRSADPALARRITGEQSVAVIDFLKEMHKIHKRGPIPWLHNVKGDGSGHGDCPIAGRR